MIPTSFASEHELQAVLAENPQLLVAEGTAPPVLMTPQLTLPDAGNLDLLFVDVDSIPIVVGTALRTSRERRRDVVAQAIHTISALSHLTVSQLDDAAGGGVARALTTLAGDDGGEFNWRWASLAVNLRTARIRFIVAVDELSPALGRAIRFLADHSRLDVQCVAVAARRAANEGADYAAMMMLDRVGNSRPPRALTPTTPFDLPAATDSVDRLPVSAGIRLVGSAAIYRRTAAPLRASAHHQFVKRAGVWIETHREETGVAGAVMAGRSIETPVADLARVQWDG